MWFDIGFILHVSLKILGQSNVKAKMIRKKKQINNIQSRQSAIEDLIKWLEEREKKIILLFFGLGETEKEMNLEEISKEMSLTKERVRQIKDAALVKLKCEALCSPECEVYRQLRWNLLLSWLYLL